MWAFTQNNLTLRIGIYQYIKGRGMVAGMRARGRPRKKKVVQKEPRIEHFSPRGRPGRPEETIVTIEEYEAIRLADYEGMAQKKAAELMQISQQSFSRIVRGARKKISDAIVNAKIIRIEGGDYVNKRSMDTANKLKRKTGGA